MCVISLQANSMSKNSSYRIEDIDSTEFYKNKRLTKKFRVFDNTKMDDSNSIVQIQDGTFEIRTQDSVYSFINDTSYYFYNVYYFAGEKDNWILVQQQDYNDEEYYLINKLTNTIDTLVGNPEIYGNKILCLEADKTDGTKYVEVWEIGRRKINIILKVDLKRIRFFSANDIFLRHNTIFIRYHKRYVKIIF